MTPQVNNLTENANDAAAAYTLLVCQNNDEKSLKIQHVSPELAEALGHTVEALIGHDIRALVGAKAAEAIEDYVEFKEDMPDLERVLSRVREFKLKDMAGAEHPFTLKILRDPAPDQHDWFRLMLKDERRHIEDRSLLDTISQSLEGVRALDEATGFPNKHTAEQAVRIAAKYIGSENLNACFAAVRIDRFGKSVKHFGKAPCLQLLTHVANCCSNVFRSDDVICVLSDDVVGLVLLDITEDAARVVLNRLRWHIAQNHILFAGKPNFSVTVSVSFRALTQEDGTDTVSQLQDSVLAIHADERSALLCLN